MSDPCSWPLCRRDFFNFRRRHCILDPAQPRADRQPYRGQYPARRQRTCAFHLQLEGTCGLEQDGHETRLDALDIACFDTSRPYRLALSNNFQQLVVQVSRSAVRSEIGETSRFVARTISSQTPISKLVVPFLRHTDCDSRRASGNPAYGHFQGVKGFACHGIQWLRPRPRHQLRTRYNRMSGKSSHRVTAARSRPHYGEHSQGDGGFAAIFARDLSARRIDAQQVLVGSPP